jgi:hypothetical protein
VLHEVCFRFERYFFKYLFNYVFIYSAVYCLKCSRMEERKTMLYGMIILVRYREEADLVYFKVI